MNTRDCSLLLTDGKCHQSIMKEDGASRWSEQLQVVDFHMKMAARAWIPTKVRLIFAIRVLRAYLVCPK